MAKTKVPFTPISELQNTQLADLAQHIIQHEGLLPNQTPFRITDPTMNKWVSMFDSTNKIMLNPNIKKPKGRENFLYTMNPEDVHPAVMEQLRLYATRDPSITLEKAMKTFDQTGSKGKLKFLQAQGYDTKAPLTSFLAPKPTSISPLSDTLIPPIQKEVPPIRRGSGRTIGFGKEMI